MHMTSGAGAEVDHPDAGLAECGGGGGHRRRQARSVPMSFGNDGWTLDFERLDGGDHAAHARACCRVAVQSDRLDRDARRSEIPARLARNHGLWIIADETYARFWYGGGERAPSFYDVMAPDDRIIFVNTFSKNWAMTGWRMGWMALHPSLGQVVENLIQYSTSGVAQFMQRAGVVAIEQGEDFVHSQIARARKSRDIACDILGRTGRCRFAVPQGAFYLFFKVDGETDTRKLVFRLIDEAQVGPRARNIFRRRRRAFRARVLRARSGSGRRRDDADGEGADEVVNLSCHRYTPRHRPRRRAIQRRNLGD